MSVGSTLLLFGDQAGDLLPAVEELGRLATGCKALHDFLQEATQRLRECVFRAPPRYRRRVPAFDSVLDLAAQVLRSSSRPQENNVALRTSLLCIVQMGHLIHHLDSHPEALQRSEDGGIRIAGICTGLVAAAAAASCTTLTEIAAVAGDIVQLSFQIGLEASLRSEGIDRSLGSWSTVFSQMSADEVRKALELFNESKHAGLESHSAYVSAEGINTVTISGPPPTTKLLVEEVALLRNARRLTLPIEAAFHAQHLEPLTWARCAAGIKAATLNRPIRHRLLSPSSGQTYVGNVMAEVLVDVLGDISQYPVSLKALCDGIRSSFEKAEGANIRCFGPVTSVNAIKNQLGSSGFVLRDAAAAAAAADTDSSAEAPSTAANDIAIVGMSVRLPGSETLEEFWKVLEDGRDLHEKIRADRFDVGTHCDPSGKVNNSTLTPYGVFIDRPGFFDTRLFNMSPREAAQTDPQMRLALLATYEALEMAGYAPNRSPSTNTRRIGSFLGQTSDDYREVNASQNIDTYFITGGIRAFGPGRLNYHFGWEGPSYSVDTACSSSAASIQLACTSLLAGECDMAIGGGVNFLTASDLFAGLSRGSFLSKTGGCKTFDDEADGYVRADAVGVVVLKRLDAAIQDRDNVLAVLKCAVTNHSAEAVSITHPHAETQERLFHMALNRAGLAPDDVDYAELHGTGTQAGDATESRSVTNVLTRGRSPSNPLYIGTVKPNLGHGEAGSGVTSLIKAVLMMRHSTIPPHVGIKGTINHRLPPLAELNTHISFVNTPFNARPDGDGKRRILINNFDAAGGNTSMIIEDPPIDIEGVEGIDPRGHHIVAVSGKTAISILNNSKRLLEYIRANPGAETRNVAYTTTARRMHHPIRQAHVVSSPSDLAAALERSIQDDTWASPSSPARHSVVFMFTGQGSQYISMAGELFRTHAIFGDMLRECERICVFQGAPAFLSLITDGSAELAEASPAQVHLALVSVEMALAALWKSFGVEPAAIIGHSLGEYAALYTAGVLSLHDCLFLVGRRASLMTSSCTPGTHAMLAVQSSTEDVAAVLVQHGRASCCEISCFNGPTATVVSGPADQVDQLELHFGSRAVKCTKLSLQFAFHSAQMDPFLDEFRSAATRVHFAEPSVPVASTLLGQVVTAGGVFSADYLARQTREPVRFSQALAALGELSSGSRKAQRVWIEVGPSPLCLGLVRSNIGTGEVLLPSLKKNEPDWQVLSASVAKAYAAGLDIDWNEFHRPYETCLRLLELPRYAFDLKNYWIQYEGDWALRKASLAPAATSRAAEPPRPSFSTTCLHRVEAESVSDAAVSVTFSSDASEPKLNKVLRGHLVNGAGLCPSSVYADMAFTAAKYIQTLTGSGNILSMDVRGMTVHKPLLIQPGDTKQVIRVQAAWEKATSDVVRVDFSSQDGRAAPNGHANCVVALGDGERWTAEWKRSAHLVQSRMDHLVSASHRGRVHKILRPMAYKLFAALVDYDDKYQGMEEVYLDSDCLEATASLKFRTADSDGRFTYSPFAIDSFAHISGFVLNGAETTPADSVFISHGWESMKIVGGLSGEARYRSYVRMQQQGTTATTRGVMEGDVYLLDDEARVVAVCTGLKFQRIKRTILDSLLPPSPSVRPAAAAAAGAPSAPVKPRPEPRSQPHPQQAVDSRSARELRQRDAFRLESDILDIIASEVGVDVEELTDDAILGDLGIDSLLSISITEKLGRVLAPQAVPATLLSECVTVQDLVGFFSKSAATECHTCSSSDTVSDAGDDTFDTADPDSQSDGDDMMSSSSSDEEAVDGFIDVLRNIIAREIGVDEAEMEQETPFADLGVDSLLSLAILDAVKKQTGRALPSSFLIDNPNLGAIASSLGLQMLRPSDGSPSPQKESPQRTQQQQQQQPRAKAVLLQGNPHASQPALFLLPDGSGSASSYVNLPALRIPGPIYGLDSPFLSNPSLFFQSSLVEVAAMYVGEIRRIQPEGPYRLGGWSVGGSYAFEAASQLMSELGETVERLVLIDAPCPSRLPPLPLETVQVLESIGVFGVLDNNKRQKGGAMGRVRDGVREHFAGSINALKGYAPRALRGSTSAGLRVTVLWAKSGVWETVGPEARARHEASAGGPNSAKDWILEKRMDQGPNGWDELMPGARLEVDVITGDHFTMMRRPNILELGEKLHKIL